MRNIQVTRYPGGVSVQPEGGILQGLPVVYDPDTNMFFDDFWGFLNDDNPWQVFADGAGGAGGAFGTGVSAMATFTTNVLGQASVVFIPYSSVEINSGNAAEGFPATKLEYQVRFSAGNLGSPQLAALGVASITTVQAGDMLANPDNAIQFEVGGQGVVDFAVYRSGVEVYRDSGLFTFSISEDEYITCQFSLIDNVIRYSVGGGGRGSTDQVPADSRFMTFVAIHSECGTGGVSTSNNVDFVMCAQDADRTNPTPI